MKNTQLLSLGVLLSAGFLLTACSNDDGVSDDSPVESTWTLTVKATKGGNEATTRVLKPGETGDKTLYATWATTENVYVYYENDEFNHGVLHPTANSEEATLTGNLTGFADEFIENSTVGGAGFDILLQFPQDKEPTWAGQKGTLADIAQNFDWATATVHVTAEKPDDNKNNKILTAGYANFENLQAIVKFTLHQSDGTALPSNPTKFTVSIEEDTPITVALEDIPSGTYTTNGNGVLYVAIPGFESKKVTLEASVGSDKYTYTKSGVTFANGKYYDITVKMTQKQ